MTSKFVSVDVVHRMWQLTLCLLAAAALTSLAAWWDDRMLGYAGVWIKPLKFQLALAVQTGTITWALSQLDQRTRQRAMPRGLWLLWFAVVMFEVGYITFKAAVACPRTSTTARRWSLPWVGCGASVLVLTTVWVGACALVQARRTQWPPLMLAIGLGFVLGSCWRATAVAPWAPAVTGKNL